MTPRIQTRMREISIVNLSYQRKKLYSLRSTQGWNDMEKRIRSLAVLPYLSAIIPPLEQQPMCIFILLSWKLFIHSEYSFYWSEVIYLHSREAIFSASPIKSHKSVCVYLSSDHLYHLVINCAIRRVWQIPLYEADRPGRHIWTAASVL